MIQETVTRFLDVVRICGCKYHGLYLDVTRSLSKFHEYATYVHIYMCVYIYIYIYVCIYMYIYIYIC